MKRFMPVILALSFTAIAVAFALFVIRPRIEPGQIPGGLRRKLGEAIEAVTEPEEADR
jgi:hypothetical protein